MIMKIFYKCAANTIFLAHILIGIFFLVGWMFKDIQWLYLPTLIAWPLSGIVLGYCPLTKWEMRLRKLYKPTTDTRAGFIQLYIQKVFGITVPRRPIRTVIFIAFFILLTLSVIHNFLYV